MIFWNFSFPSPRPSCVSLHEYFTTGDKWVTSLGVLNLHKHKALEKPSELLECPFMGALVCSYSNVKISSFKLSSLAALDRILGTAFSPAFSTRAELSESPALREVWRLGEVGSRLYLPSFGGSSGEAECLLRFPEGAVGSSQAVDSGMAFPQGTMECGGRPENVYTIPHKKKGLSFWNHPCHREGWGTRGSGPRILVNNFIQVITTHPTGK